MSGFGLDDWFGAGGTLEGLRARTVRSLPNPKVEWVPPIPLDEHDRPSFPVNAFPETVRSHVEAVAEDTQVPVDLPAVMHLGTVSASVAGKFVVAVSETWDEPVHGQMFCAMGSGNRKTANLRHAAGPLLDHEREQARLDRKELARWKAERRVKEGRLKRLENQAAEPEKEGKPKPRDLDLQIAALAEELEGDREPRVTRHVVDDVTPEKMTVMLYEQRGALAAMSAEGGFFANMTGRYSDTPNLDVWLKGHSCDPLPVDRIGREGVFIPRPALTICVAPQPLVIAEAGQVKGVREKGAAARLWPSYPRSTLGERRTSTETTPVPEDVASRWKDLVLALLALEASPFVDDDGYRLPHRIGLSAGAKAAHAAFEAWIEPQLREGGDLGHIEGWGSKLAGAAARIAGLLHLAMHAHRAAPHAVPISAATMTHAIAIARYFAAHALIFFDQIGERDDLEAARQVLHALGELAPAFDPNYAGPYEVGKQALYQRLRKQRRFTKADALTAPLRTLEEHGYCRVIKEKTAGRPAETVVVNLLHLKALQGLKGTADTQEDPPSGPSRPIREARPDPPIDLFPEVQPTGTDGTGSFWEEEL